MKIFKITSLIAIPLIASCSAVQLMPAASKILVTKNPVPKNCKYMGSVVGGQGGSFFGSFTSNRNLSIGAMNDIKNQALGLGANYVQIESDRAGQTASYSGNSGGSAQTDVTITGNAYYCKNLNN